jgi:hypothetical protein
LIHQIVLSVINNYLSYMSYAFRLLQCYCHGIKFRGMKVHQIQSKRCIFRLKIQYLYVEIKYQIDATDDFYCRSYCLLNMFRAPLCPSSGAREYYTGGCWLWYLVLWFSSCRYGVEPRVMCPVCGLLLWVKSEYWVKFCRNVSSLICGNTMPTRCNR